MNRKIILYTVIALLLMLGATAFFMADRIDRARTISTLFTGAEQLKNFPRLHKIFPTTEMAPAPFAKPFPIAARQIGLPESFTFKGKTWNTLEFLGLIDTAALLVLKDGEIVHEQYRATGGEQVQWMSMSVAKSFISALLGIAIEEGHIGSIEEPISDYVPTLRGSAYDGVRIKDVLQMSSGASWNEDYNDPESDINRFARIFALGGSMNDFTATLQPDTEPGVYNKYNSTDTQALSMLLTQATGRSVTDYMVEKLYHPLGAESPGYWLTDSEGMEMGFAGLNLTARDYAKLGELYRNGGKFEGQQIVPNAWVRASITPDGPHLMPGEDNPLSNYPWGYGYQWWVPSAETHDFSAVGVYNQFIYVSPKNAMTVVMLSANRGYGASPDGATNYEFEAAEFLRTLVETQN